MLNVLKHCIVPLPQFCDACARAFMCYTCSTYAASVALTTRLYVCDVYGSKLFGVRCLPNSTHWIPITHRCCAFYCQCRSVNGTVEYVECCVCVRTNWPMRNVCLSPTDGTNKPTNYLLLWYDWLGWRTSNVSIDTNNEVKKRTEWPLTLSHSVGKAHEWGYTMYFWLLLRMLCVCCAG